MFCLFVQVFDKNILHSSDPQGTPLPAGLHAIDHHPLSAAVQLIFHQHYSPPTETISLLCLKDAIGDHPENCSKDRVNDIQCFPISCIADHLIIESY